ncbi:DUF262 domain-containing protein [Helicobacter sp. 23-1044]
MSQNNQPKSINELKNHKFFIPSYQRGYRWGDREVGALLEDIWDFANAEQKDSFYCLQPIVVKQKDKQYNVIDGQQRLTTIFLIVKFLSEGHLFDISYETRQEAHQDSREFLQNIQSKSKDKATNIDFYHFYEAYKTIKEFFSNSKINKDAFLATLLNNCKVLWYEIAKSESESAVFRRLNIGKIPLQEAENIKALFLSKNENLDSDDIKERAQVWYKAEIDLRQERDFRYCVLSNISENDIMPNVKPYTLSDDISRIKAYLKAISSPLKENKLFEFFDEFYKNQKLDSKWEELESCIDNFQGFASKGTNQIDREIFHYIGFLTQNNEKISKIYAWWRECGKSKEAFAKILFEKICEKMRESIAIIDELDYRNNDKREIHALLLLANLQYVISDESSNKYFEFNRFALERWSLEHIYAQNSQSIKDTIKQNDKNALKEWLKETQGYIENKELKKEISAFVATLESNAINKKKLEKLLKDIDEDFKNSDSLHNIGNLSLLDKDSNAKLGNLIFSKKREKIEQLGKEDKLIPILTQKVFDKSLGNLDSSHKHTFNKSDREAYLQCLKDLLHRFARGAK